MSSAPTSGPDVTALDDIGPLAHSFALHLRAGHKSPATIRSYLGAIQLLDEYLAGQGMPRLAGNLTREHVEAFISDQLARLKPASAANRFRSLQQFFKWLVEEGEIRESPMARMKPPTIPETPPPVITEAQKNALLAACKGSEVEDRRDMAILHLFWNTGIRRAEMAGLRLEDVDLHGRLISVVGKGSRPRFVPFHDEPARDLDRYLRARPRHARAKSEWLWLGRKGRLTETGIAQMLRRRARLAGLNDLHPHLFRHSAAHNRMAENMSEGNLMRLMGWKSRTMVSRYGASAQHERAVKAFRDLDPTNKQ